MKDRIRKSKERIFVYTLNEHNLKQNFNSMFKN